jgi:hypothetical protein
MKSGFECTKPDAANISNDVYEYQFTLYGVSLL